MRGKQISPTLVAFDPLRSDLFKWTGDGDDRWYEFDSRLAHKEALRERNAAARQLRKEGHTVTCWTLPAQLRTLGGIGTGNPLIEEVISVYFYQVVVDSDEESFRKATL